MLPADNNRIEKKDEEKRGDNSGLSGEKFPKILRVEGEGCGGMPLGEIEDKVYPMVFGIPEDYRRKDKKSDEERKP